MIWINHAHKVLSSNDTQILSNKIIVILSEFNRSSKLIGDNSKFTSSWITIFQLNSCYLAFD